jgi:porin
MDPMKTQNRRRFLLELQSSLRFACVLSAGTCAAVSYFPAGVQAQETNGVAKANHLRATERCDTAGGPLAGSLCDDPTGSAERGSGVSGVRGAGQPACDAAPGACDSLGASSGASQEECVLFPSLAATRKEWEQSGFVLQNNLTQFYFGNTSGGVERDFRYAGHGDYLANFDFGKLIGKQGAFLKLRAEHRFGETINDAAGVVLPPTIAGDLPVLDSTNIYLTNCLFTQALSESFVLYAGKLDTLDGDMNAFAHGRGIRQFSNGAFVANPIALRTIPYSTLGTGMAFLMEGEPWLIFNVLNATDTTRTVGLDQLFNDGVALASEMRIPTNFFGKPGHQLIAGTWNSREFTSLDQDPRILFPNVPIAKQSGSWSLYWNCDQYLVTDSSNPKRGWGYFGRAGIADQGTNPLGYFLSGGIGGSSPFETRQRDSFGVGYYYAATSNEVAPFINAIFGNFADGQGVEMFYNIATGKRLTITPDLQVLVPSREKFDTALLVGLRANYNF